MSLDVYLHNATMCEECCATLNSEHWVEVFTANVTHNLAPMAEAANLYNYLWRPDEIGIEEAHQLAPLLAAGLKRLLNAPEHHENYTPENGWGSYVVLVDFIRAYLKACDENPGAIITVSR